MQPEENETPEYIVYDWTVNPPTATISLTVPLLVDGAAKKQIVMRAPKVRDEKLAQKSAKNVAGEIETTLMANLCGIRQDDLEEMFIRDYKRVQEAYFGFLK